MENATSLIDLSTDWDTPELFDFSTDSQKECVGDALVRSLHGKGYVDLSFIAGITGKSEDDVIALLGDSIFQNPEKWNGEKYKGWETADEYLSGNLFEKRKVALNEVRNNNLHFKRNIEAIDKIRPNGISFDEVRVHPGMSFIPTSIIDDFIQYLFGAFSLYRSGLPLPPALKVIRDEVTGSWEIPAKLKSKYSDLISNTSTFGTKEQRGLEILEDILNNRDTVIYYPVSNYSYNATRTVNKAATALALEKRKLITEQFEKWIKSHDQVRNTVEQNYMLRYGFLRKRHFNGSFVEPDWGSIRLYDYQRDAIARIILTLNCLLALPVGRGKTNIMAVSAMEILRLGLAEKIVFSVPNGIIGQYKTAFNELAPDFKVTFIEPETFKPAVRNKVLEQIRDSETGIFVFAYSCFDMISLSRTHYINNLRQSLDSIEEALKDKKNDTSALRRRKRDLNNKLQKLILEPEKDKQIYFDELDFNMLYLDEAHNYKGVSITTSSYALGINKRGSNKCNSMMDKVHYIQRNNGGRGIVFATATPVSNSMTDIYVMQRYLQSGELEICNIGSFDSWINEFCDKSTEFEIDVDTSGYRLATRYSKFVNLPELTSVFSSVIEYHAHEEDEGLPEFDGYTDVIVPKTEEFSLFLKNISARCEAVRKGAVKKKEDNMLKITVDGRLAALDMRLVKPDSEFTEHSKVSYCADKVFGIYSATMADKSTQVIFCDSSTPKDGFNIYDELKRLLTEKGVPENEIAYIHEARNGQKREKLFKDICSGKVRIVIGSTFKLGTGVNIQERLIAVHHIDIPWRPSDMIQRQGRMLRRGNTNEKVYIYRYITEGSFDAYSYQLLETKQRIISKILKGDEMTEREVNEIDDSVLSYAEVKALAIGNPLLKERFETANELARFRALRTKSDENRIRLESELEKIPAYIKNYGELIFTCMVDAVYIKNHPMSCSADRRRMLQSMIADVLAKKDKPNEEICIEKDYCGFKIFRPANMPEDKPYLIIERNGRYRAEMGEAEKGIMMRVDNVIKGLPERHEKLKAQKAMLEKKRQDIINEIENLNYYKTEIELYQALLNNIDKRLGAA